MKVFDDLLKDIKEQDQQNRRLIHAKAERSRKTRSFFAKHPIFSILSIVAFFVILYLLVSCNNM